MACDAHRRENESPKQLANFSRLHSQMAGPLHERRSLLVQERLNFQDATESN